MAFKEWFAICEALGRGAQDIIIRKGGIHEGRGGFEFVHDSFYLFPTLFHKQLAQVKQQAHEWMPTTQKKLWSLGEIVPVKYRCTVERSELLTDWDAVLELSGRHVYTEGLVAERYGWEGKGMKSGCINVAYVRTEVLIEPLEIAYQKSHGGCRSWIE
ncbi:DUF1802 family protein, partial [Rubritalea sp.]|uniref:DUF1802 family protein n=1 Tax=Rubritalea sp. TaxID=2109375 RepID=UPI00324214E5